MTPLKMREVWAIIFTGIIFLAQERGPPDADKIKERAVPCVLKAFLNAAWSKRFESEMITRS
jgi:hypothetical protein